MDVPSFKLEHQRLQALRLLPARLSRSYKPHAMSRTGHAKELDLGKGCQVRAAEKREVVPE